MLFFMGKVLYGPIYIISHTHHISSTTLLDNNFEARNTATLKNLYIVLPFIVTWQ